MNTPICDFVRRYAQSSALRLHMPGHKGNNFLGIEALDITEIDGADALYDASGIIKESENNASKLFGCDTFYSTEGSSLCIRAMMHLVSLYSESQGKKPTVLAARNVHRTFLTAAAMLDIDVQWIFPSKNESYMTCTIEPAELEKTILGSTVKPCALYITSPDYLGNVLDIEAISRVCKKHGVLLVVDNAHGAYLRFLEKSQHPIDLGADMCCDSAHKTLPVLTGGAYLHISKAAPKLFCERAADALGMFGSTSPSYLILQSLDMANAYLDNGYSDRLREFSDLVGAMKRELEFHGYTFDGIETIKLSVKAKDYGYTGHELAQSLRENGIEVEFCDADYVVMMLTLEIGKEGVSLLKKALLSIPKKEQILSLPPEIGVSETAITIRQAVLSECEEINVSESVGRIVADVSFSCPPAVPIIVCGEVITEKTVNAFRYYGIKTCRVVKEKK